LNQELQQLPATSEDKVSKKETGSVVHPTQVTTLSINQIQKYKDNYFPTSPITAEMIFNQSAKSGVPADFILAVGHNESHMGTKGRAVQTKNPMNVGNVTAGDNKPTNCSQHSNCLNDWQTGLDAFTSLISQCYFHEDEEIKLQTWIDRDFRAVRCNIAGKRYMTDTRASIKYAERIQNLKQL
jgi:protein involved in sex pheromone biosynthesis